MNPWIKQGEDQWDEMKQCQGRLNENLNTVISL